MVSKGQKLAAAGAVFLVAEPALAFAHTGGIGAMIGLAAGVAAYVYADDLAKVTGRDHVSLPAYAPKESGKLPLRYRLLNGKSVREGQPQDAGATRILSDEEGDASDGDDVPTDEREPTVFTQHPHKVIQLNTSQVQDINDVVGKAIFIAGIRRSGKTTLGARIAEELGKHLIPLLLPDMEGDLLALAEVLPRALIVGHPEADTSQYPGPRFAGITAQQAQSLGYDILDKGFQVILDLASYPTLEEGIRVQVGCIRGMIAWADAHPTLRCPSHVYLDEAQRYLPQTLTDSVIQDRVVVGELLRAYMDVIAIGGKRGIAPIILTQRFAQVNKKIMAQSEVFFLMRQTHDKDLERCMEYVKKDTATEEDISKFKQGQGVYIAADGMQQVCQFLPRRSNSSRSSTPRAEAAERYASMDFSLSPTLSFAPAMQSTPVENRAQRDNATRNENAQDLSLRPDVERAQPTQNDATGAREPVFNYRLSDQQITELFALYPHVIRNKDHALARVGANSAYRAHFNYVIQQRRNRG